MKFTFNDPHLKDRRSDLRQNSTDSERLLWSRLRARQISGLKFFRQYSVGPYILDFYCPTKHLAIEVDGGQHMEKEQKEYDEDRTAFLESHGIRVVRFWSNEILKNLSGVLQKIENSIIPLPPS
ncbi:MAG TPA: endonuclease domain-containing protein [Patescibacteria group bacterium]|nr:endonuclease domain-containing protein [Patescibacteria group bacterium]